jgi:hypothetical protein
MVATSYLECRRIFFHPGIKVVRLENLFFDFRLVIIIVGEGVIYLTWREMRKLPQDFLNREAKLMIPHDGTDRKAGAAKDWTTTTYFILPFDIR